MSQEAQMCVSGCGEVETAHHLFLSCATFSELWRCVRDWLGVYEADPIDISDHFQQFIFLVGSAPKRRSFMQLFWLLYVWIIWNERNNRLFKNKALSIHQLLEKVNMHSYWWMKAANAVFVLGVHSWLVSPLVCLGM